MYTPEEKAFFLEHGYLHATGVLDEGHLALLRIEFDRVWDAESPKVNQHKLLKYQAFIDLLEHPPIIDRHRAIFGAQTQLLQYDFCGRGQRATRRNAAGTATSFFRAIGHCRLIRFSI